MTDTAIAPTADEAERKRKAAVLKAIGLDRVPVEQRELMLAIANRYELDLMLRHVVPIDGKPYVTRDGLLHIAHRSGQLDGIEVTDPELVTLPGVGDFWRSTCSVYRKDMSRPFRYMGRYPAKGGNVRFAPEMAVKVAEVMALRRAFDVSLPVFEERWDVEQAAMADDEPEQTITESIAAARARIEGPRAVQAGEEEAPAAGGRTTLAKRPARVDDDTSMPATDEPVQAGEKEGGEAATGDQGAVDPARPCGDVPSPNALGFEPCEKPWGHEGAHRNFSQGGTWPPTASAE